MTLLPSFLCDTVHSIAVHNGIARLVLVRLDAAGASVPVLEVAIPVSQVGSLVKSLAPIARG